MDTAFDYSKTYYKVVREDHNHNGFIYRKGLNILNEPFNDDPNASCVRGRLYFTDYENLPVFLCYGELIYKITIPEDARVVKDPKGDRCGADRLVLGKCYRIVEDFDRWFDKKKFNYKDGSFALAAFCSAHFDKWFDKEMFNYEYASDTLATFCSEHFEKWFDKDKLNYDYASYALAAFCSEHFDKWFDKEMFNYRGASYTLAEYCSGHFDKWFDKEMFNYGNASYTLAIYCSEHFGKWFDEEKFNFDDTYAVSMLKKNCSEYKHIWGIFVS